MPSFQREQRIYAGMLAFAAIVLIADQASKVWAISALSDGQRLTVIPGVLRLRLLYNPGAAFSMGSNLTWVFALTAAVAVAGILYGARRVRSLPLAAGLGAVLGGAASHLLDRLLREPGFARGRVVDFIDYGGLFVGNVADIALTCGAIVLAVASLGRTKGPDQSGSSPVTAP